MKNMDKPISIAIKETRDTMMQSINNSGLPISILELLIKNIYYDIHLLAMQKLTEDELIYTQKIMDSSLEKHNENAENN